MDGTRVEPDEKAPSAKPAASSYERYKQQLHAFFNGETPLPDNLRDMLATRPGASDHGFEESEADLAEAAAKNAKADKKSKKSKGPAPKEDDGARRRVVAANAEDVVLIEAIRRASSPREVQSSVDALISRGFSLPKDAEVLGKALGHPDDNVLEAALTGLRDVIVEGSFKGNPTLLKTRLKNAALLSSSSSVRELCAEIGARL
jgi:hypothetical protein